jgi:TonB-linked SusC/RagA family outer membrane protein
LQKNILTTNLLTKSLMILPMEKKSFTYGCYSPRFLRFLFVLALSIIPAIAMAQQPIKGVVKDAETKDPLPGVTVRASSTNVTITNEKGEFSISASPGDVIRFLYLSFKTKDYKVTGKEGFLDISLFENLIALQNVVVEAGIIKRDRQGFTGSYSSFSKEELKSTGNINLIQSLKSLDPAFVVVENNLSGSNPNALANIELRGQTSMNITSIQDEAAVASNLPLFILDGFEASLQEINDLDINRVESITILKDAGSTAIYGLKGANGIVVIETVRPTAGKFFVSYNGDFQVATPDLSVYNMMNAAEKLEFERLAGRYNWRPGEDWDVYIPVLGFNGDGAEQRKYFDRLKNVMSGVDSDWLSEPVRVAFTQAHSITISGGEKALLFDVGVNYKNNPGVMKGSVRDTYGGNVKLVYRGIEGLSIQNNLYVSGTTSSEGAWGSFSDFVNANPYYLKREADGTIPKYLDRMSSRENDKDVTTIAVNPLYNATLNTRHDNKIFTITNNTSIDWTITRELLMRAGLGLKRSTSNPVDFIDPSHSRFDAVTYDKKGSYTGGTRSAWSYNANVSLNYLKSIEKNNFTVIGRYNVEESSTLSESYTAVGFPEGAVGYPSYAFSYQPDQRPTYSEQKRRNLGLVGAFNYNYGYRYLFDLNYNLDGSTNFGKNRRFQSFWSVGLGWNIHKENFIKDLNWLKELKLRGTYGSNGSQDISVNTNSIYAFYVGSNYFGQSSYLSQVGNLNLRWKVVKKMSAGLDAGLLNNNLRFNFDVYKHTADPQIVILDQRPSTGVAAYPYNLGFLKTKGYEFRVYYNVINRVEDRFLVSLRFTGGHNKDTYGGFEESLHSLNEAYKKEENSSLSMNSLQHYEDGRSSSDIWAVRSLGIDPATGREVFQAKDGTPTFAYNPDDRVVIANTRPDIQGIFGFTVRYKKIMLNANLRYYVGAYAYNNALYNKVENIIGSNIVFNQDKRALYDRWHNPGDVSQFKRIFMVITDADRTPRSSRFIQKNDYLRGESVKLTWDFTGEKWLKTLNLKDFSVSLSMEDFFNLYSIKIERGTDYPFQRSVVMNLSARF